MKRNGKAPEVRPTKALEKTDGDSTLEELQALVPTIRHQLLDWFRDVRRDLPWRRTRDPYLIWVSEVMLQQTTVRAVIPYYERWAAAFPTVESLAQASDDDVLQLWQGLGYYSRARRLLAGARAVIADHGGRIPQTLPELLQLPGLGPYSAGAIASIAFGQRCPVVDGNVIRVLTRLLALRGDPTKRPLSLLLWRAAGLLVDPTDPGTFNQALMELGAIVCTPTSPMCELCPLAGVCRGRAMGLVAHLPEAPPRPAPTLVDAGAAIVVRRAARGAMEVLLVRAAASAARWAGLWLFPASEVQASETTQHAAQRALFEQASLVGRGGREIARLMHTVTRFRITLRAHAFEVEDPPQGDCRWQPTFQLGEVPMPTPHRRLASLCLSLRASTVPDRGIMTDSDRAQVEPPSPNRRKTRLAGRSRTRG